MIGIQYSPEEILHRRQAVREALMERSAVIHSGRLDTLDNGDLKTLFLLYDEMFLKNFFQERYKGQMNLGFSRQLTSSAGITKFPRNFGKLSPKEYSFEMKISANFLFDYHKTDREKKVSGILTQDSLEALMLVFEHELCHVIEYLHSFGSSCKKQPFKQLAFRLFGHTEVVHALPTGGEINGLLFGFKVGDKVSFDFEGVHKAGLMVRMNKRATVMVPERGGRYVDTGGKKYNKYHVVLEALKHG